MVLGTKTNSRQKDGKHAHLGQPNIRRQGTPQTDKLANHAKKAREEVSASTQHATKQHSRGANQKAAAAKRHQGQQLAHKPHRMKRPTEH